LEGPDRRRLMGTLKTPGEPDESTKDGSECASESAGADASADAGAEASADVDADSTKPAGETDSVIAPSPSSESLPSQRDDMAPHPENPNQLEWPSVVELNTRLRRVITAYQRNFKKEELRQAQKAKVRRRHLAPARRDGLWGFGVRRRPISKPVSVATHTVLRIHACHTDASI